MGCLWSLGGVVYALQVFIPGGWLGDAPGSHAQGMFGLVMGPFLVALGLYLLRTGPALQTVNGALDAINRGKLDEAESLLHSIPSNARRGVVAKAIHLRRAIMALVSGRLQDAVDAATAAVETRPLWLEWGGSAGLTNEALAIRAQAAASMGEAERARADIATVRSSKQSTPQALAKASLAEALVLARSDRRDDLAALIGRDRSLLLEYTSPRERALVRALQRMIERRRTSVYREPAKREEPVATEELPIASWIATVAPAAAEFAPRAGPRATSAPAVPVALSPGATGGALPPQPAGAWVKAKARGRRGRLWLVGGWVALVVMFLAIWQFLQPSTNATTYRGAPPPVPASPEGADANAWWPWAPGFLVFIVLMAWVFRARARQLRAMRSLATGDLARAEREYTRIAKLPGAGGAGGELQLAVLGERAANFDSVLQHAESGLAKTTGMYAAACEALRPELLAQHCYALAALGKGDQATAELASLVHDFPRYAFLSRTHLCVRMHLAVHAGRLDEARSVARERTPDMPLTVRDETLADALVAIEERAPEELARLERELREDAQLATWMDRVAPDVVREVRRLAAEATRG
jgi:hypothetical protein